MILQKENPILREVAKEVPIEDIPDKKIQKILREMKTALYNEPDGLAIAAPQIGVSLRIFIVNTKYESVQTYEKTNNTNNTNKEEDLVFINPEIIKLSKEKEFMFEGCLSVRWLYGQVKRAINTTIRAYDEKGRVFERGSSRLLAQIFQHEMDHLNGILFIDKAQDLEEIRPGDSKNKKDV